MFRVGRGYDDHPGKDRNGGRHYRGTWIPLRDVMWCDRISRNGSEVEKSEQDKPQVTEEKAAAQPQDGFDLFD